MGENAKQIFALRLHTGMFLKEGSTYCSFSRCAKGLFGFFTLVHPVCWPNKAVNKIFKVTSSKQGCKESKLITLEEFKKRNFRN